MIPVCRKSKLKLVLVQFTTTRGHMLLIIYLQAIYIIGLFIIQNMTLYSRYFLSLQISMTYIDYMKSAQNL